MTASKTPGANDQRFAGGLVRAAGVAALLVVIIQTTADQDLWGHVRFGQDIIAAGQLPTVDGYSFTSDRAWINHEWLAEVIMAAAYAAGGASGLVALKTLLAIGALVLVTVLLRQRVPEGWRRALLVAFTLLVGVAPLTGTMRPQVFPLFLFVAVLAVIATAEFNPRRLWWLPPVFLVWANLHGGWLVGASILVVWSATRFIDTRSRPWRWQLVAGSRWRALRGCDAGESLWARAVALHVRDRGARASRYRRVAGAHPDAHPAPAVGTHDTACTLGRVASSTGRCRTIGSVAVCWRSCRSRSGGCSGSMRWLSSSCWPPWCALLRHEEKTRLWPSNARRDCFSAASSSSSGCPCRLRHSLVFGPQGRSSSTLPLARIFGVTRSVVACWCGSTGENMPFGISLRS